MHIAIKCHLNGHCAQRWEGLEPVLGAPHIRYCSECRAAVHLVKREAELAQLSRLGKCTAIMRE